jgi:hypothetical protein
MSHDKPGWEERLRRAYRGAKLNEDEARRRLLERLRQEPTPRAGGGDGERPWGAAGFVFRPALAAAVLVIVFGIGAISGWTLASRTHARAAATPQGMTAAANAGVPVVFALPAPDAESVALVGDFNGWDAGTTPLRRAALGSIWTVEVALPPGIHTYAFVVDGRKWIPDPGAPLAPVSEYDTPNSVVIVGDAS